MLLKEISMDPNVKKDNVNFSDNDYKNLYEYIQSKNTAILVVMFTDIKGFTKLTETKGDRYANDLRMKHDEIMREVIEKENAGKIIKYIGDAIMAVFTEPTTAVQKALEIQREMDSFNQTRSNGDELKVRIGLHMGQVAVDNTLKKDIFGRHVNRASRVQGLADGGQIYVSYPVFDSALGWLVENASIGWKAHGFYFLKGIDKPAEIYEVFDSRSKKPMAPKNAKKKTVIPGIIPMAAATLLGCLISLFIFFYEKTEIIFMDYKDRDIVYIDNEKEFFLDGKKGDKVRHPVEKISKGKHFLNFKFNSSRHYIGEFEVKSGKNIFKFPLLLTEIPSITEQINIADGEIITQNEKEKKGKYFYYANGEKIEKEIIMRLKIHDSFIDKDVMRVKINFQLVLDGKEIFNGEREYKNLINNSSSTEIEYETLWGDEFEEYGVRGYMNRSTISITLEGNFK